VKGDERGCVVEQALSLEHRDHAPWKPDPAGHGFDRHRVVRRDDGAEREGRRKPDDWQQRPCRETDDEDGEEHRPERQDEDDVPPVSDIDE
jgi:hypothetical protein